MFGRIADAITTRLLPFVREAVREEIAAQDEKRRKDVRELVSEMEDVLEKFSRVVARQAKRRTRDMKDTLVDEDAAATTEVVANIRSAAGSPMTKEQLRQQYGHMLFQRPRS